jgi:hypothetical protein
MRSKLLFRSITFEMSAHRSEPFWLKRRICSSRKSHVWTVESSIWIRPNTYRSTLENISWFLYLLAFSSPSASTDLTMTSHFPPRSIVLEVCFVRCAWVRRNGAVDSLKLRISLSLNRWEKKRFLHHPRVSINSLLIWKDVCHEREETHVTPPFDPRWTMCYRLSSTRPSDFFPSSSSDKNEDWVWSSSFSLRRHWLHASILRMFSLSLLSKRLVCEEELFHSIYDSELVNQIMRWKHSASSATRFYPLIHLLAARQNERIVVRS